VAGVSGVLVIISTFFSWISGSGVTGWSMMSKGGFGSSQNFLFSTGGSRIVFSGFWSLLFGVLIVGGAVTLITGWGGANGLVLTAGILGLIISVLSIVMIYTLKLQSLTPGQDCGCSRCSLSLRRSLEAWANRRWITWPRARRRRAEARRPAGIVLAQAEHIPVITIRSKNG